MTNTKRPALIHLSDSVIDPVVDEFCARLDAQGFPVLEVDLEEAIVRVNAKADPDEYSILMAGVEAATAVGLDQEDVLFAELV